MENKDTNTDYYTVVRVGDQKWQIAEITTRITFVWDLYFLYKEFSSPIWKKSPPPTVPILTQNPNWT